MSEQPRLPDGPSAPDGPGAPVGPRAPGHSPLRDLAVSSAARADLLQLAWPQPLRLASWGTAVARGLVPLDAAVDAASVPGVTLELGKVISSGRPLFGLLAEPGSAPEVALPSDIVTAAVIAGGVVLSIGSPGVALVVNSVDATLLLWQLSEVSAPPAESLGTAERRLLETVNGAAEAIAALGVSNPDPEARAVLGRLQRLLDANPMPPGTSARARLLRDRAATLLVGIELALHPSREAPSQSLDDARRTVLVQARRAGRAALTAASNDVAFPSS